jgi:P-type conjugative transfer protein TrbJ
VLTAARELQQVNNEIQGLENQATMLINQGKNLASLPYSTLAQLDQSISQTQQLLAQAQNIGYDVTTIDQAFAEVYPPAYSSTTTSNQLESDAQSRWENARAGYQDAMNVQAGVVQNLAATHAQVDALVSSSQGAEGSLQASQAGNQLLAIQSGQLADITSPSSASASSGPMASLLTERPAARRWRPLTRRGTAPAARATESDADLAQGADRSRHRRQRFGPRADLLGAAIAWRKT